MLVAEMASPSSNPSVLMQLDNHPLLDNPPWFHQDDPNLAKFSGRLRRPGKIGYFGVSKRDFTRGIDHFEGLKTQNFPAAEGGRKNRYFGPSKSPFLGGKTVPN